MLVRRLHLIILLGRVGRGSVSIVPIMRSASVVSANTFPTYIGEEEVL